MAENMALTAFIAAFAATTLMLFGGWINGVSHQLRRGPKRPHIVLGKDLRGRTATITDMKAEPGQRFGVDINGERWQAQRMSRRHAARKTPMAVGDQVIIKKIEGLTVFVEPAEK